MKESNQKRAGIIKNLSLMAIGLFMFSCTMGSREPITFKLDQPLGQKSKYAIKNDIKMELVSEHLPGNSQKMAAALDAILETEVTAGLPDGNWTLENRFTRIEMAVDGESIEEAKRLLENRPFTVTMDKTGKVLDVSGIDKMLPGMDIKQMMSQMNPASMLPSKAVAVGESWPIEISAPVEMQGTSFQQKLKGTGTLKEVNNGLALIDITYDLEMSLTERGDESRSMTGKGKSKSSLMFDMQRARFISNKTDLTMEVTGRERSGSRDEVSRSLLISSMQVDLAGE